jgi:hypothetical protein
VNTMKNRFLAFTMRIFTTRVTRNEPLNFHTTLHSPSLHFLTFFL